MMPGRARSMISGGIVSSNGRYDGSNVPRAVAGKWARTSSVMNVMAITRVMTGTPQEKGEGTLSSTNQRGTLAEDPLATTPCNHHRTSLRRDRRTSRGDPSRCHRLYRHG
jgi:hypothetical protein